MGITVFHYTIPSQDHQSCSGTTVQRPLQQTPLEAIWALSAEDLVSFRRIIVTMTEGCFTIRFQPIDMKTFGLVRSHFSLTLRCLSTTYGPSQRFTSFGDSPFFLVGVSQLC